MRKEYQKAILPVLSFHLQNLNYLLVLLLDFLQQLLLETACHRFEWQILPWLLLKDIWESFELSFVISEIY